jgi:hypothetical protein
MDGHLRGPPLRPIAAATPAFEFGRIILFREQAIAAMNVRAETLGALQSLTDAPFFILGKEGHHAALRFVAQGTQLQRCKYP